MSISGLGPSLGLLIANAYNRASAQNARAIEHAAAGTRVMRASDDPSAIGRIEQLKSQISENRILAAMTPRVGGFLAPVSEQLGDLITRAQDADGQAGLEALVVSLRAQAQTELSGKLVFAGDSSKPEMITVTHPATSGNLVGGTLGGTVTLSNDGVVFENGAPVQKATLNLSVDGSNHTLKINAGTYTAQNAVTAVADALEAQTALKIGEDVNIELVDGAVRITSLSTGTASQVSASGGAAAALGLSGGVTTNGTNTRDEQVEGAPGPVTEKYAGRELTFANLNKYADELDAALQAGDLGAAEEVRERVVSVLGNTKAEVDFAVGRMDEDTNARTARANLMQGELDRLTKLDTTANTLEIVRTSLMMEQAAWAMRAMQESLVTRNKMLLGIE